MKCKVCKEMNQNTASGRKALPNKQAVMHYQKRNSKHWHLVAVFHFLDQKSDNTSPYEVYRLYYKILTARYLITAREG